MDDQAAWILTAELDSQDRQMLNEAISLMIQGVPLRDILQEFAKIEVWRNMRIANYTSFDSPQAAIDGKPPETVRMPNGPEYDKLVQQTTE